METFSDIINADKPVFVDFYADWCGPCKAMDPVLKEVSKLASDKARFIKINIDKNENAARKYNVQAVPTFMIFKKGQIIWRHPGMISKADLMNVLAKNT